MGQIFDSCHGFDGDPIDLKNPLPFNPIILGSKKGIDYHKCTFCISSESTRVSRQHCCLTAKNCKNNHYIGKFLINTNSFCEWYSLELNAKGNVKMAILKQFILILCLKIYFFFSLRWQYKENTRFSYENNISIFK